MKYKKNIYTISLITLVFIISIIIYKNNHPKKEIHLSLDDVILSLEDISNQNYSSITGNDIFSTLSFFHTLFGCKFDLYVYKQNHKFDIRDTTIQFKEEFEQYSSWLKFGYHATTESFDTITACRDLKKNMPIVQNEITRFAGIKSLANRVRLHGYWANDQMLCCLYKCGVKGLLSADDSRISYNLSPNEVSHLSNNETIYHKLSTIDDTSGKAKMIRIDKTDYRLESMSFSDCLSIPFQEDPYLVVFTHEWAFHSKKSHIKMFFLLISYWLNNYL